MTEATINQQGLSGRELVDLLALAKESDSIELKTTVPEGRQRSAINALNLDPLDAQIRQVFFFDTPDLALDKQGVVARARRVQGKGGDSVVKLRPVVPAEIPGHIRRLESFRVEVDALPGGYVCSGTMKGAPSLDEVQDAAAGKRPLHTVFTKDQRAFFTAHVSDGIALDELAILGPIFVLKLRLTPDELRRRLVAEMWLYPDGSHVLELSTRCGTGEAFQVAAELRAFLHGRGIDISGEQQTKTRKALAYFAETLR